MRILMTLVLALAMCTTVSAETTNLDCQNDSIYTTVGWYPGKHAVPAVRGAVRGAARIVGGAARATGRVLKGAARGVGRAVVSHIFKVTVVTNDETVVFYRVAVSKNLLDARLKVNANSGFLLVRTPKGIRLIPSGNVKSVTVEKVR